MTSPTLAPNHIDQKLQKNLEPILSYVAAHRFENHQRRDIKPEIITHLKTHKLLQLFQPKQWGGLEADPRQLYAIQNQLAHHCPSTAWVFGVLNVQAFVLSLMNPQAQQDVWGTDSATLISSSFMPAGKAQRVEGGVKLSGQWAFSSGSSHAQWAMLGAILPPEQAGSPPAMTLFLVPREDYEIKDTWHTIGLCGTGSNDIVVTEAFVPTHRSFQPSPGLQPDTEETRLAPLYRLPWLYVFTSTISNVGIGIAEQALATFLTIERQRVSGFTGKTGKEDPNVQQLAATLSAEIDSAKAMYERHLTTLFDYIETPQALAIDQAMLMRTQLTSILRKLAELIDQMQQMLGGRGIRQESPFLQLWLDMCAARAHPGNDPAMMLGSYGKWLLDKE